MDIVHWLLTEGRYCQSAGELLSRLCDRLNAKGFSLVRASMQLRTLHPEVSLEVFIWRRDGRRIAPPKDLVINQVLGAEATTAVDRIILNHGAFESEAHKKSPFYEVVVHKKWVQCAIEKDQKSFPYPIIEELHAIGATGYTAAPMFFQSGTVSAVGWVTDKPGGFTADDTEALEKFLPALTVACEVFSLHHTLDSLVRTYLGNDPGRQVLSGRVKSGDVRSIEAAIWFSDLRGFTRLSGELSSAALVATLNDYFAALSEIITRHGGEILKFIGDAVLVIFPVSAERDEQKVARDAVSAALEAEKKLDTVNLSRGENNQSPLEHGVGLHFGQAQYGNIGTPDRLDFTVIGRDVNCAARVVGLCGKLGERLLATAEIVAHCDPVRWHSRGEHELKGIQKPVEIFSMSGRP